MIAQRIRSSMAAVIMAASLAVRPMPLEERIARARRQHNQKGAVSVALVNQTNNVWSWTIISTADGDTTTGAIAHTLGAAAIPSFIQVLSQGLTALSAWSFVVTQTTWTGTKLASTGSGNAGVQAQFTLTHRF